MKKELEFENQYTEKYKGATKAELRANLKRLQSKYKNNSSVKKEISTIKMMLL